MFRLPIYLRTFLSSCLLFITLGTPSIQAAETPSPKKLAYLVSDIRIPFWQIMAKGVRQSAQELGYELTVYSSDNLAKQELKQAVKIFKQNFAGLILSPTTSSSAATVLNLAKKTHLPVVIADIGADSDQYVSYIGSDNEQGAYQIGQILAQKMNALSWQTGGVGIIAIPQKRQNGKDRTAGFLRALKEHHIKPVGMKQQVTFSYQETYNYAAEMLKKHPNLRAIWLQGSNRYQAALDAIKEANRSDQVLLLCFDAEPEFLTLIPQNTILAAAMQQPFLIGEKAVEALDKHLNGQDVKKIQKLPVLAISKQNITEKRALINRNVFGIDSKAH